MRLLLTAVTCPKGQPATNLARHLELLAEGREAGCDLVLLPEMSLTGYCPAAATSLSDPAVEALVRQTSLGPDVCFGLAESSTADGAPGPAPYITQVVASRGRVVAVHRKAGLGEGEDRDFRTGPAAPRFTVSGTACSIAVCAEIGTEAPYASDSTLMLAPAAPGLYGDRRMSEEDFPGWAALVGPGGEVVAELTDWRVGTLVVTVPPTGTGR